MLGVLKRAGVHWKSPFKKGTKYASGNVTATNGPFRLVFRICRSWPVTLSGVLLGRGAAGRCPCRDNVDSIEN